MQPDSQTVNGLVKRCRVCGDKSLGFNFNGLSCESCKAFFRRNALRHQELVCAQTGNCKIDMATRKFCQLCRLNKCFDIGMKKELILTKEGKRNWRRNKQTNENEQSNKEDCKPIEVTKQCPILLQVVDPKVQIEPNPLDSIRNKLSEYEYSRINQINQLAKQIFPDERTIEVSGKVQDLITVINMKEAFVPTLIAFVKGVEAFRELNKDDQLLIFKQYFTEQLILRGAFSYNWEHDAFLIIADEAADRVVYVNLDIFYQTNQKTKIHQYRNLIHFFNIEMEQDEVIRNLLSMMLLFSHHCNTSFPEYIIFQYHLYSQLLRRYLQAKYPTAARAITKYQSLLQVVKSMPNMTKVLIGVYSNIDSNQVARLLAEIYNLQ